MPLARCPSPPCAQETQYRPVVPKAEAEAEPHAPAPLSGASPPELSALLLSEAEGSSGCSSLSSSGESNASFAAAQMQAQFSKLQEQRREQAERQAEEQEKGQAEVLCCDDLRLVRTQTRCVQVRHCRREAPGLSAEELYHALHPKAEFAACSG